MNTFEKVFLIKQGPPGPPPRSGWEWHEETKRWRNPENWEKPDVTSTRAYDKKTTQMHEEYLAGKRWEEAHNKKLQEDKEDSKNDKFQKFMKDMSKPEPAFKNPGLDSAYDKMKAQKKPVGVEKSDYSFFDDVRKPADIKDEDEDKNCKKHEVVK